MLLTVLKHLQQWDFMARLFSMNGSTFKRLIVGLLNPGVEHTYEICVQRTDEQRKMFKCIREKKMFRNFDYASYAKVVTVQQSCRPIGSVAAEKAVFS